MRNFYAIVLVFTYIHMYIHTICHGFDEMTDMYHAGVFFVPTLGKFSWKSGVSQHAYFFDPCVETFQ
jgi:hypothetical protein